MTPRPYARTPSTVTDDVGETPRSDSESGDESLPPHTSEIGTLKKLPNQGTAWLGSSSGVYFVNTVRRAFSAALVKGNNASTIPASEDILTGDDADGQNFNGPVAGNGQSVIEGEFRRVVLESLGHPPSDRKLAMELVTTFFRCWHPLFPFMHGPRFLQDIEAIYALPSLKSTSKLSPAQSLKVATFQLIINIASLDRSDVHLPVESRIKSTSDVTRVAGCHSVNHDLASIQLLIAAELYLVATISLRQASTVAGMILKLIYHAGLHRCPLRYAAISTEDCDIRRRIFWSAYALDRHLSLALGDPNTVQDNDIDVCLSGRELHKAVAQEFVINPNDELKMHLPRPKVGPLGPGIPLDDPRVADLNDGPQAREKTQREAAMTAYVHYGKLTGRITEIFHKSIHARFQKPEAIVFLNSDIENWWNDLPASFTSEDDENATEENEADAVTASNIEVPPTYSNHESGSNDKPVKDASKAHTTAKTTTSSSKAALPAAPVATTKPPLPTHRQLAPFFTILYHQLLLLLNRPRLSLDQSTADFQHGLQICIKASRNTLTALKHHRDNNQSMLLPGLLSAAWMAGLIIAFACQLGKYPKTRAVADIRNCLGVLQRMGGGSSQWFTVKNCHKVLSLLLENIRSRKAGRDGFLTPQQQVVGGTGIATTTVGGGGNVVKVAGGGHTVQTRQAPTRKRTYDEILATGQGSIGGGTTSPTRKGDRGGSDTSPGNSGGEFRVPARRTSTNTNTTTSKRQTTKSTRDRIGGTNNATSPPPITDWSGNVSSTSTNINNDPSSTGISVTTNITQPQSGSALYANPRDISLAQSNHTLPHPSTSLPQLPSTTSPEFTTENNDPFLSTTADPNNNNINNIIDNDPFFSLWGPNSFDLNFGDIFGAASWENMMMPMSGGGGGGTDMDINGSNMGGMWGSGFGEWSGGGDGDVGGGTL